MPELPEVETVRAGLERHVAGRVIASAEVLHPRAIRRHVPGVEDFTGRLGGVKIEAARRRGKYLWLDLADGEAMLAHLGMSGQLLVQPEGAPDEKHLRARFRFADGGPELRFVDQRTFGGLALAELVEVDGTPVPNTIAHIARDPMDPLFDAALAVRLLRAKRTEVKRALLDQTLVSGVGNIYADEALWRSRLHWARPTERLTVKQAGAVLAAAAEVMAEALVAGGTSFDALYVNVNGQSGYFDRSLDAYGRVGEPCRRCGTPIRRDPFMNRSSFSCPRCQPKPRARTR
ncbi:DNA-formamidopyrimidine glycosylase [Prauserella sp. PE36]|uniref:Formamidopyrimidine-DNA glycosylase n=1 Tax=Prauserella endophytica TaxID=1592324 RepID=A0ABY2S7Y4_9PSEU|nr:MULTISPECIES: bifunctional DNA-formamidopyrimidine glycosylase/DNA-(apurinic or apyrimidinic site) lyase [Prauserella]PXY26096.1 DNA-formamidopyrimidine glycosylase [Prauserella coralliicola]RBM19909.1 DNA-formamidopyrimidine glycosylase [Prauserella sp. PE36]TKG71995.1 bifunctional DNA-formamidopyrimidine glycosylase/DNA-(apurinic or apyrimidinic site) lyase [Prauserella endophytica]